ncbi:MAG: hypothetical protein OEU94_06320 [Aquincola sp.]|nr:hypothetical protein [Aquincola sp.]
MNKMTKQWIGIVTVASATALAAGCGSGSGTTDSVTVNGDVAIAYAKRASTIMMNPTDGTPSAPGGDLIVREKSSPSANEINVTASITQGNGDVSDPEVSYDGKKIVFAMKCPTSNTSMVDGAPACTGNWNIWEYDMTAGGMAGGSLRRITSSGSDDDVDPAYLPAGRGFVFSSNRQTQTRTVIGGQVFYAVDEYERERTLNLHTMNNDGGAITQISVNQSHDRNPVVRSNGDIMFARWEHVGPTNRFSIFSSKPDGTNMFVLYGQHSPGNSFLHPREMDPAGQYRGMVASSLMSLSGTREGGALKLIDIENFPEHNMPANRAVAAGAVGQRDLTSKPIPDGRGLSLVGRATSPYPLWDGTDRILVAFHTCEVTKDNVVVPCAQLTQEEIDRLNSDRTDAEAAADTVQDNVPPIYSIYMYDPRMQTWLIVASPPSGFMYVDPVAIQARPEPASPTPTSIDASLAAQGLGLVEVRSIYDTDQLQRMGENRLAPADLPAGCSRGIAQRTPTHAEDTRDSIADIVAIKDPANPAYHCAPGFMVRAFRAVAPMAGMTGMRQAIGETDFEPQQILGYAPVEPDGSFKLLVPADTPMGLAIIDAKGRALQTHLNWIQVRPGERRTCDGCHSPRRGASINDAAIADTMSTALRALMTAGRASGETMASTRTKNDASALNLSTDMLYSDVWADTAQAGITARASIAIRYAGNANAADDLATTAPTGGFINYPDHIQPIWERSRSAGSCVSCHTDPVKLDLRGTISGTGRLTSYQELLLGDPLLDANGQPVTRVRDGVAEVVRGPALVETMPDDVQGLTRSSRLGEILYGEQLKAGAEARAAHPNPPGTAPNHATMLNAAERRLVSEWMDLGGQYFNNINASTSPARSATALSREVFDSTVHPILTSTCMSCHQPVGSSGTPTAGPSFVNNRFVLTGSGEGDFNVTLSMITDTCNVASNALLQRPSTSPHPSGAIGQPVPLPAGGANYNAIAAWISAGCRP